jgi:alkylated DNA repair dioxygenase AlkB
MSYAPEFLSPDTERQLMREFCALPFRPFEFQGFLGRRRVVFFGRRYDFNDRSLGPAEPIPSFLEPLRDAAAGLAGVASGRFAHALVTEYAPGAAIGWHRDRPEFGVVAGVSFGAPCRFRLRRRAGAGWERRLVELQPRSAYVLDGPARSEWEHSIPAVEALRYSVTFRTVRAEP